MDIVSVAHLKKVHVAWVPGDLITVKVCEAVAHGTVDRRQTFPSSMENIILTATSAN